MSPTTTTTTTTTSSSNGARGRISVSVIRPRRVDSPCTEHSCPPGTPDSTDSNPDWSSSTPSPSVRLAFFGVGIILAVGLLCFGIWCFYRRRKNRRIFPCCGPRTASVLDERHFRNGVRRSRDVVGGTVVIDLGNRPITTSAAANGTGPPRLSLGSGIGHREGRDAPFIDNSADQKWYPLAHDDDDDDSSPTAAAIHVPTLNSPVHVHIVPRLHADHDVKRPSQTPPTPDSGN